MLNFVPPPLSGPIKWDLVKQEQSDVATCSDIYSPKLKVHVHSIVHAQEQMRPVEPLHYFVQFIYEKTQLGN